jgi:hypothetical protein
MLIALYTILYVGVRFFVYSRWTMAGLRLIDPTHATHRRGRALAVVRLSIDFPVGYGWFRVLERTTTPSSNWDSMGPEMAGYYSGSFLIHLLLWSATALFIGRMGARNIPRSSVDKFLWCVYGALLSVITDVGVSLLWMLLLAGVVRR